jgi:hypothetical protein
MLTDEQVINLATWLEGYISVKVSCGKLVEVQFRGVRNEKTLNFVTGNMSTDNLGDMRFTIADYHIKVRLWILDDGVTFVAQPSFRYEHHDGGSNGCDMNFRITGNVNGTEIMFQYRHYDGRWS